MKQPNKNEQLNKKITSCIINDTKKNSPKKECRYIGRRSKPRKTHEKFVEEAITVHDNKYDYIEHYIDAKTKIRIKCNACNDIFLQCPHSHLRGQGCRKCGIASNTIGKRDSLESFIRKETLKYGDKYDLSLVDYKDSVTKITLICRRCGSIFKQTPNDHLSGCGCKKCNLKLRDQRHTKTQDEFIRESVEMHGFKYDYSKFKYVTSNIKGVIICNDCKLEFEQTPNNHLNNHGCPNCNSSIGECKIRAIFDNYKINYSRQKIYNDLRGVNNGYLKYDFYVPSKNLLIEFDGEQHYSRGFFGGIKSSTSDLKIIKEHDRRKTEYARINNIDLLRIPYYDMGRIAEILKKKLKL
jgi:hypothetical protein